MGAVGGVGGGGEVFVLARLEEVLSNGVEDPEPLAVIPRKGIESSSSISSWDVGMLAVFFGVAKAKGRLRIGHFVVRGRA
jgi:hypothetical protein